MIDIDTIPDEPPSALKYRRKVGVISSSVALWQDREIVRSLADRDFRARYKQAVLGFAWAIINPLILVLVFTFTLGRFTDVHTARGALLDLGIHRPGGLDVLRRGGDVGRPPAWSTTSRS